MSTTRAERAPEMATLPGKPESIYFRFRYLRPFALCLPNFPETVLQHRVSIAFDEHPLARVMS